MGDASAVIFGRNYKVYSAPYATSNAIPANTIVWGEDWAAPYADRGYTTGGLVINLGITRGEIRVDQELDPIARPITARAVQFQTSLAEATPANFQLTSGLGTITTVPAVSGTRGNIDLDLKGDVADVFYTWGFDIQQQNTEAFRALIYRGMTVGNPQPRFEASNLAGLTLDIAALVDSSTNPSRIAKFRDVLPALA